MQCHVECQALPHSAVPSLFIRQWLYAKTYLIFAWLFRGSWDTITVKKNKNKNTKCFKVGVLVSWSHYNKHHRLSHSLGGWKPEIGTPAGWGSGESSLPSRQVTALTALSHGEEEERGAPGGLLLLLFSPSLMSISLPPIDSNIPRLPFPLPSLGDVQF